jgi:hypothetical protein
MRIPSEGIGLDREIEAMQTYKGSIGLAWLAAQHCCSHAAQASELPAGDAD